MDLQKEIYKLTPGGSEFHESPIQCLEFIKDRMDTFGTVAKERNEYRDQLKEAKALLEKWATSFVSSPAATHHILIDETSKFLDKEFRYG